VREGHLRAQQLTLEAGFALRERALLSRLAEEEARHGEMEALRLHVVETILTPKCPRCAHAFIGFNGCFALRCAPDDEDGAPQWAAGFCGAGFCAWCFADCGDDAHAHVLTCAHNLNHGGGYYGTMDLFDASLRSLRSRTLRQYLANLAPAPLRPRLLAALRDDLADLGLDAGRDRLLPNA
jgi:hypothetical protein